MKKVISLVLILTMILTCFSVVRADSNLEELTLMVKSRLEITEEYKNFSTSKIINKDGEIVWFEWKTDDNKRIYAEATEDGIIINYSNSDVRIEQGISKFSSQEIAKIANEWMKKLNPSIAEEYIFTEDDITFGYGASASANRMVNGIEVERNYADIGVDTQNGKVSHFFVDYTPYEFSKPEGIIDSETAEAKFKESTSLTLFYIEKEDKFIPVYVDLNAMYGEKFGVDAFSGEIVEYEKMYYKNTLGSGAVMDSMKEEASKEVFLTEEELKDLSKYDNFISPEEAFSYLKGIKALGVDGLSIKSASYTQRMNYAKGEEPDEEMILTLRLEDEKTFANASFKAKSGELISFSSYGERDEKKGINTEKTADEVAEKVFKNKKYEKLHFGENRAIYHEYYDALPILKSTATISVDEKSGFITGIHTSWIETDKEFSPWNKTIANAMALKIYMDAREFRLIYKDVYGWEAMPLYKIENSDDKNAYILLYQEKFAPFAIDAISGTVLNENGEEYKEEIKEFTDVKGHWCEKAVEALVSNNYMTISEGKFNPNEIVSADKMQEMLNEAGIYSADVKGENNINREEAVKAIITGIGYEKVGALKDIFVLDFKDAGSISPECRGYIAIAKGFGIVAGDQHGNFNPKAEVTKGTVAVMIYNYLLAGSPRS